MISVFFPRESVTERAQKVTDAARKALYKMMEQCRLKFNEETFQFEKKDL